MRQGFKRVAQTLGSVLSRPPTLARLILGAAYLVDEETFTGNRNDDPIVLGAKFEASLGQLSSRDQTAVRYPRPYSPAVNVLTGIVNGSGSNSARSLMKTANLHRRSILRFVDLAAGMHQLYRITTDVD